MLKTFKMFKSQRSCGKVRFSVVSACLFKRGGSYVYRDPAPHRHSPVQGQPPLYRALTEPPLPLCTAACPPGHIQICSARTSRVLLNRLYLFLYLLHDLLFSFSKCLFGVNTCFLCLHRKW